MFCLFRHSGSSTHFKVIADTSVKTIRAEISDQNQMAFVQRDIARVPRTIVSVDDGRLTLASQFCDR
jgi:hypothetical protein